MLDKMFTSSRLRGRSLIVLAVLAGALVIGAAFYFAARADSAAIEREQQVVRNGLKTLVTTMAMRATPETIWDEAVLNLDVAYDPAWAEENIGVYFSQTDGFEAALVLDRNDAMVYAMRDGATVPAAAAMDLVAAYSPLVREVREAEQRRAPLAEIIAGAGTMSSPIMATQIARIGDTPAIVSAVLVQPDFGAVMPTDDRAAIVVTLEALDADAVASFADQFLLQDARLEDAAPIEAGRARVPIFDFNGRAVAVLDWQPPRPGTVMLWQAMPPLVGAIFVLCGIALSLFGLNSRATDKLVASEARATHLAYHDALTGLPNRLLLGERLGNALENLRRDGASFAVHCIDLDRFKEVNDTFGHQAGDELIQAAARKIAAACRGGDTLARTGGDEFAIVQPHADRNAAAALATRVVEALATPFEIGAGVVFAGGSAGVTIISNRQIESQECLRQADLALYQVKASGRGAFAFFEQDLDQALKMRRQIRDDLRQALARGDELRMVYQPQVEHGEIYGVEALLRWDHPTRGAISPSIFIPIAEENGLIEELGAFTLKQAFIDSKRLQGLRIAVNVSAAQIRLRGFVDQLRNLLSQTAANPDQFELEVTEGILLGDEPAIHTTLERLRALGFRIALDDFGTGYSSLSYLQRYPIDKIKIDRSFIANLGVADNSDAVVGAIVRLARALHLDVIAEGVETEAQRLRLAAAGCGDLQGYLFGRPVALDELCQQLSAEAPGLAPSGSSDRPGSFSHETRSA